MVTDSAAKVVIDADVLHELLFAANANYSASITPYSGPNEHLAATVKTAATAYFNVTGVDLSVEAKTGRFSYADNLRPDRRRKTLGT